jgi:pyruvate/oxaloacetate carboxyltransferase
MWRSETDVFSIFGQKFIGVVTAVDIRELMLTTKERAPWMLQRHTHETTGQDSSMRLLTK